MTYGQSFLKGQAALPLDQEVEPFFKNLAFTSMENWESAPWERMKLAAKQARERSEAELYCVQALRYVGESTVNNLYEYAALLKTLGREDADAA